MRSQHLAQALHEGVARRGGGPCGAARRCGAGHGPPPRGRVRTPTVAPARPRVKGGPGPGPCGRTRSGRPRRSAPLAGPRPLAPTRGGRVGGPSGLLDEPGLARLVRRTRRAVTGARRAGLRPLLVGGDCAVVLDALAALRDEHGRAGLLMADGHEDAWPPRASTTGEASDSELGVALGLVPDPPRELREVGGVVAPSAVALLGLRDRDELDAAGVATLAAVVGTSVGAAHVPDRPGALVREALQRLDAPAWRLHVDLDVQRTGAFPAVGYPQPGGLTWDQLTELAVTAWRSPGCAGASVAVYDPDLDPDRRSARRPVDVLGELVGDPGAAGG
ncbi:arginase family protein [Vallicoccus soli]|uniref:arginase family protein n=1 Tax=Vallicoccus soli TaxID=2339232 RepID=UPI00319E777B